MSLGPVYIVYRWLIYLGYVVLIISGIIIIVHVAITRGVTGMVPVRYRRNAAYLIFIIQLTTPTLE